MRRSGFIGLAAGAALLAGAGAASAADMFSDFDGACLKTAGDRAAALAFADAAGWTSAPPGQIPPSAPNFKLKDVAVRVSGGGPDKRTLIVGSGETAMAGRTIPAEMCLVAGAGGGLSAQVQSTLGLEPTMTMNMPNAGAGVGNMTLSIYMFRDAPGGRTAVSPAELAGAGPGQPLVMVMVMSGEGSKVGMLGRVLLKP